MLRVLDLEVGDYTGLSKWNQSNHESLQAENLSWLRSEVEAPLLDLQTKWPQAKECRQAARSWKGKETDALPKPPDGTPSF